VQPAIALRQKKLRNDDELAKSRFLEVWKDKDKNNNG
jgi:hypothetical protein